MQSPTLGTNKVLHVQHDTFENEVTAWLESQDFFCHSATYHNTLPEPMTHRLQHCWTETAMYLRGRADRVAVHKVQPFVFEYECKTHDRPDKPNMALELGPLGFHLAKARYGVKCLYIYRHNGRECGFWIHEMPPARVVMIPPKWTEDGMKYYAKFAAEFFPGVNVVSGLNSRGSGDPFVIVDASEVARLHDWHDLVGVEMGR